MRPTLFWKEMHELAPVLGILAALEVLIALASWRWAEGNVPGRLLAAFVLFAAAAVGASLFLHERRPGTLSLLFSLPIARSRILAAKLAAGLAGLLLVAAVGQAARLTAGSGAEPDLERGGPWWTALLLAALLSAVLALRVSLDWQEPLLALLLGGGLGTLAFSLLAWVEEPSDVRSGAALLAAVAGAAAWSIGPRFATLEDRAPRWSGSLLARLPASRTRAPSLLAVEWRQKRVLLGALALLPLVHLVGVRWIDPFSIAGWAWPAGASLGASLFTARERDGSRFLLHVLPLGRGRLAAARLLGGLVLGGVYLAECLLVLWASTALFAKTGGRALEAGELLPSVLIFVFFYGTSFLLGAALSPWLRSTLVTAILALVGTWLLLIAFFIGSEIVGGFSGAWAWTGALLVLLAAIAAWSAGRSRSFEPMPRKDLRVILTVFVVWLAIAGTIAGLALSGF